MSKGTMGPVFVSEPSSLTHQLAKTERFSYLAFIPIALRIVTTWENGSTSQEDHG